MAAQHRTRGQSLVEFALVTPLILIVLLITVDFARAFSAHIEIGNAAREGANFGSRTFAAAADEAAIESAAQGESGPIFGEMPDVTSHVGTDSDGYEYVEVTVNYQFEPIASFLGLPDSIDLERSARMRILEV